MDKILNEGSRSRVGRNCWEVKRCGREPGGGLSGESGICPAASDNSFDGINSGKCGGRICWAVAGTFCGGLAQGTFAEKRNALGITAFEMVTGRRPFSEDNAKASLDLHFTRDIMDPKRIVPDIPEALRAFIVTAARCHPNRRYQNMDQAMEALRPLMQESMPSAKPTAIKRNRAAFVVSYTDDHRPALDRLMERFKTEARALGAEVANVDPQGD